MTKEINGIMTEVKIKKDSWNKITVADYDRIMSFTEDESLAPIEIDIKVLSVLCDVAEDEIWNMTPGEVGQLRQGMKFLNHFDFPKKLRSQKMVINGEQYEIQADVSKFTVAQYVDFQQLWKDRDKQKGVMLSVFIVPRGKKYNEGYNATELADTLYNSVSIVDYNTICFFFLKELRTSIEASLLSSIWMLERMMRKEKNPEKKEEIKKAIAGLREKISSFGFA